MRLSGGVLPLGFFESFLEVGEPLFEVFLTHDLRFLHACPSFPMAFRRPRSAENICSGAWFLLRRILSILPAIGAVMTVVAMVTMPWMMRTDSYHDLRVGWGTHCTERK
jgi:hypothetical protein